MAVVGRSFYELFESSYSLLVTGFHASQLLLKGNFLTFGLFRGEIAQDGFLRGAPFSLWRGALGRVSVQFLSEYGDEGLALVPSVPARFVPTLLNGCAQIGVGFGFGFVGITGFGRGGCPGGGRRIGYGF